MRRRRPLANVGASIRAVAIAWPLICCAGSRLVAATLMLASGMPAAAQGLPTPSEPTVTLPIERPPTLPEAPPPLEVPPAAPGRIPPGAEGLHFTLRDLRIEGATAIPTSELSALYAGELGQDITVVELFAIADRITALYRDKGYVLSRALVPAQRIGDGAAKIQVIEGYVSAIAFEGEVGRVRRLVERYMSNLLKARPVRLAQIERYLLLSNDIPGVSATAVLRPGNELGAAELVVTIARKRFEGFASINNRGSDFIGPWTGAASVAENSFTALGEQTSVLLFGAEQLSQQRFIEGRAGGHIGGEGFAFDVFGSYGPSEPGSTLSDLGVKSLTTTYGGEASYPLVRTRGFSMWLESGYEWSLSTSDISGERLYRDRMDIGSFGARFAYFDALGGINEARIQLRQGLPLPGTTRKGDPDKSRADASGVFTAFHATASRRQPLLPHVEAYVATEFQYAGEPLLTDAEVKFGGTNFLRGYPPAELSGDSGQAVSIELRVQDEPRWPFLQFVQGYTFFEYGAVRNLGSDADPTSQSLRSVGTGVRWLPFRWLSFELELAQGLDRQLSGDDTGNRPTKLYFTATASF